MVVGGDAISGTLLEWSASYHSVSGRWPGGVWRFDGGRACARRVDCDDLPLDPAERAALDPLDRRLVRGDASAGRAKLDAAAAGLGRTGRAGVGA